MRQIPLDLSPHNPASFDNFVPGRNAEALALLRALAARRGAGESALPGPGLDPDPTGADSSHRATDLASSSRGVYLWGEPGSGKSHLLAALAAACGEAAQRLDPASPLDAFDAAAAVTLVDDCDRLDPAQQEACFHLFNRMRETPGALFVASGSQAPLGLALREDLRTRLGWGTVLRLTLLDDTEKEAALKCAAKARGLEVSDEFLRYLMTRRTRDIRHLFGLLEALDRYALERKRALTLPLLHEFERSGGLLRSH